MRKPKMTALPNIFMISMVVMVCCFKAVQSGGILTAADLTITVDGSKKGRDTIDDEAFDGLDELSIPIESINLANNKLKGLEKYQFPKFETLHLNLSDNRISKTKNTFARIVGLKTLDMSKNSGLKKLGSDYLVGLTTQSQLIMGDDHRVTKISCDVFGSETILRKTRDIESNDEKSLSKSVQRRSTQPLIIKMRACIEDGNLIEVKTEAPEAADCSEATYDDGIIQISSKINRIEEGWCCEGLESMQETLDKAASRQFGIDLSSTGITEIAEDAFEGLSLRFNYLKLNSNNLTDTTILRNIGDFKIKTLEMANNSITVIKADSFSNLEVMVNLDLSHNKITTVESLAFKNNKLEFLYLNDNQISSLEEGAFAGLEALTSMYLKNNHLTEIPSSIANLLSLIDIDVSDNNISIIKPGTFKGLKNINTLRLQNNPIAILTNGALFGLPLKKACNVHIQGTQIKVIPGGLFENVTSIPIKEI